MRNIKSFSGLSSPKCNTPLARKTKERVPRSLGFSVRGVNLLRLVGAVSFAILLAIPVAVSADYEAFDINNIPNDIPLSSTAYQMLGQGNTDRWDVQYIANSKVTQFDRLTMPFCRYLGANGGVIDLEIRTTSTSSPIVASSTLTVNSGNVWSVGCGTSIINATTSTWVLNNNVQWEIGSNIWFSFYARGTSGTFYHSFELATGDNGITYGSGQFLGPPNYAQTYHHSMTGYALGIPPVVYNASSSNVICTTFDVGCYINNAFSFLFIPDQSAISQYTDLSLASSSPFSYAYDAKAIINTFFTATPTTTDITINFVGTPLTLFSTSMINNWTYLALFNTLISAFLYLLTLFAIYRLTVKTFTHHDN